MRILVTGGLGFIGSHVVELLATQGHTIAIVDDLSTGTTNNLVHVNTPPLYVYNILDDLTPIFQDFNPEIVIHLAAQISVRDSINNPLHDAQVNIMGTLNVAQTAAKFNCKRLIFASSGGTVYGDVQNDYAIESMIKHPLSPYGVSKLCAEQYLDYLRITHSLDTVILRLSNVYGPRQNPHGESGVIAIFLDKLHRGEPITINGDGQQIRDFVYVTDVAHAIELALTTTSLVPIFNIGTGIPTTITKLASMTLKLFPPSQTICYGPAKAGEQRTSILDIEWARRSLQWAPIVSLNKGLQLCLDHLQGDI